jgi:PAS domain S-box-containing protein
MGTIKRVNTEVTEITGFLKDDLIGQSLNIIQPKCISEQHDQIL